MSVMIKNYIYTAC